MLSTALLATPAAAPARPPIAWMPIPYPASRKREMSDYSQRHYGHRGWRLRRPRVIVEHTTQSSTVGSAYNSFAPDVPDSEPTVADPLEDGLEPHVHLPGTREAAREEERLREERCPGSGLGG